VSAIGAKWLTSAACPQRPRVGAPPRPAILRATVAALVVEQPAIYKHLTAGYR
jgi:hypothetical protein